MSTLLRRSVSGKKKTVTNYNGKDPYLFDENQLSSSWVREMENLSFSSSPRWARKKKTSKHLFSSRLLSFFKLQGLLLQIRFSCNLFFFFCCCSFNNPSLCEKQMHFFPFSFFFLFLKEWNEKGRFSFYGT